MRKYTRNFTTRVARFIYNKIFKGDAYRHAGQIYTANSDGVVMSDCVIDCRSGNSDSRITIDRDTVVSCHIVLERDIGSISIGHDSYIGNSNIICATKIDIGNSVLISWGCTIVDHDSHSLDWKDRADDVRNWREGLLEGGLVKASQLKNWNVVSMAPIRIEDKVWLGMNVTVLKGVTIGEGAVVAAGSIVTKDVQPWTLVAGNPARVIKELPHQ